MDGRVTAIDNGSRDHVGSEKEYRHGLGSVSGRCGTGFADWVDGLTGQDMNV